MNSINHFRANHKIFICVMIPSVIGRHSVPSVFLALQVSILLGLRQNVLCVFVHEFAAVW